MSGNSDHDHSSKSDTEDCVVLLDSNRMSFSGPINPETVTRLLGAVMSCVKEQPLAMDGDDDMPTVYLHVDSPGGCLHSGLRAYDGLRRIARRCNLVTVAEGLVASAGTLVCLAATQRRATRNSWFLFHQLSAGVVGKNTEIQDEAVNCRKLMKQVIGIYAKESGMRRRDVKRLLANETNTSAREAQRLGFVQRVL